MEYESSSDSSFMESEGEMDLSSTGNDLDLTRQIDLRSKIVKVKGGTTRKFVMADERVHKKKLKQSGHCDVTDSIESDIESEMNSTKSMAPTIATVQGENVVLEHNSIDVEQVPAHQIGENVGDENNSIQMHSNNIAQHVANNEPAENDAICIDSNLRRKNDESYVQSSSTSSSENSTRSECNDASQSDIESQMDLTEPMAPTVAAVQVENVVLHNNEDDPNDVEQVSAHPIGENFDCEIGGNQASEITANEVVDESAVAVAHSAIDPNAVSGGHGLPSMNTMLYQVTKTEPIRMESFGHGTENDAQAIPVYEISSDSEDEQPAAKPDKQAVLEDVVARLMKANDLLFKDNQNLRVHVEALQSRVLQQNNTSWNEPSASSTPKTERNNGHDQQENREPN